MFRVKLRKKYLAYMPILFDVGQMKARLILLGRILVVKDYTTLISSYRKTVIIIFLMIKHGLSVTVEYLLKNNQMISQDKYHIWKTHTLEQKLYQILVQELILNVKAYSPLLTKLKTTNMINLLLHTGTDYVDLLSSSLNTYSDFTGLKSWFSIKQQKNLAKVKNLPKICSQLYTYSTVGKWADENIQKRPATQINCRKYKLKLNADQEQVLNKFLDDCRFTYNCAVELIKKHKIYDKDIIRDIIVTNPATCKSNNSLYNTLYRKNKTKLELEENKTCDEFDKLYAKYKEIDMFYKAKVYPELYDTPKSLRYNIVRTLLSNYKTGFTQLKNKTIKHFDIRYKSRKNLDFSTVEEDANCVKLEYYNHSKNKQKINKRKQTKNKIHKIKDKNMILLKISCIKDLEIKLNKKDLAYFKANLDINHAIKLKKTYLGWYIYICHDKTSEATDHKKESIVGLDPGQRTFLTGFDLDGNMFKIGSKVQGKLKILKRKRDKKLSEYTLLKNKKYELKYKEYKKYTRTKYGYYTLVNKLRNCVTELHNQAIKYLTDRYDKIILPVYKTQSLIIKGAHAFNDMILSLNHYEFKTKLISKCQNLGKTLIETTEYYTSKTCSICNYLHPLLGSNEVYDCSYCNHKMDRDTNAAFNIMKYTMLGSLNIKNIY